MRHPEVTTSYACGFALSEDAHRVALIQKARPEWQRGKWNGIGGHVEKGEHPEAAMVREFAEETGVHVPGFERFLILTGAELDWRVHFFRARVTEQALANLRSMTDERVHVWRVDDLMHLNVVPNLRWLIPLALQDNVRGTRHRMASEPMHLWDAGMKD